MPAHDHQPSYQRAPPEEETYSSIPRDPTTDPLWQDHWKACAWPLPEPRAVVAGEQWVVQGARDDGGVWVEVAGPQEEGEGKLVGVWRVYARG